MRHASDCLHCDELRERVAWLESELGIQREADTVRRIREALKDTQSRPQVAQLLAALYAANGRPMSRYQILEALPTKHDNDERGSQLISVLVCHARKALGKAAINTVWGHGFYLTPLGMAKVREALGVQLREAA